MPYRLSAAKATKPTAASGCATRRAWSNTVVPSDWMDDWIDNAPDTADTNLRDARIDMLNARVNTRNARRGRNARRCRSAWNTTSSQLRCYPVVSRHVLFADMHL